MRAVRFVWSSTTQPTRLQRALARVLAEWQLFRCALGVHVRCDHAHVVTDPACALYVAPTTRAALQAHRRRRGWSCRMCLPYARRWFA